MAVIETEGIHYARLAENLAVGRGFVGVRGTVLLEYPPLFPALIAGAMQLGLSSEAAGRGISLILGASLPFVVFLLGRKLYGFAAGAFAGLLAAVHPLLVALSVAVLSESTSLFLSLLGAFAVLRLLESNAKRHAVVAGVCFGAAYLCRPEALIVVACLTLLVVAANRGQRKMAAWRAGQLLLVFAVFAVPYVVILSIYAGQFRFEAKTQEAVAYVQSRERGEDPRQFYFGISADLQEQEAMASDLLLLQRTHASVFQQIAIVLRTARDNIPTLFRGLDGLFFGQPLVGLLAGLGLFTAAWGRGRLRDEIPLLVLAALTTVSAWTWPFLHDRFYFPVIAPLIVWSGGGIEWLRAWGRDGAMRLGLNGRIASVANALAVAFLVAMVCVSSAVGVRASDELSQSARIGLREDKAVGQWLRTQVAGSALVVDTGPTVTYYANAILVPYPWTDGLTALRYLEIRRVDFVIVRDLDATSRPYLSAWLARFPEGRAKLIRTFAGAQGNTYVYRWVPAT